MADFKIYDCNFGITVDGVNYSFEHVDSFVIENPERTRLVRGANASDKVGLIYTEGIKEAKTITVTIVGCPIDIFNLLKRCHADKTRLDCYAVSKGDGSSKIAKNSVLSQEPQQLSLDESAESLNIALMFESYDVSEVRKA